MEALRELAPAADVQARGSGAGPAVEADVVIRARPDSPSYHTGKSPAAWSALHVGADVVAAEPDAVGGEPAF